MSLNRDVRPPPSRLARCRPALPPSPIAPLPRPAGVAVLAFSRTRIFEVYYFRMASHACCRCWPNAVLLLASVALSWACRCAPPPSSQAVSVWPTPPCTTRCCARPAPTWAPHPHTAAVRRAGSAGRGARPGAAARPAGGVWSGGAGGGRGGRAGRGAGGADWVEVAAWAGAGANRATSH